jgi:hypothetical protein
MTRTCKNLERQARKDALQAGKKPNGQTRIDSNTGKKSIMGKLRKTHRQVIKERLQRYTNELSNACKKRLKDRQEKTQTQARKDSKTGKKTFTGRQDKTQTQAR